MSFNELLRRITALIADIERASLDENEKIALILAGTELFNRMRETRTITEKEGDPDA